MKKFKIEISGTHKRLDIFLTESLENKYSRSAIKHAIGNGFVLVNNKKLKPSYKLKNNDEIVFSAPTPKSITAAPENIPVDIVFEDDDIIVVNKPAGMVIHPAPGNYSHTLVNALLYYCKGKLSSIGSPLRPGVVHRLDKDVSGILVLAKTDIAYKKLVDLFKQRSIERKYLAIAKGKISLKKRKIVLPIGRSKRDRKKMAVLLTDKRAKLAVTYYEVLEKCEKFTKVIINLGTGRTHQIRVHMSYIGHPILGDTRYGGPKAQRLMLHAFSLRFTHPIKDNDLYFEIPTPEEFNIII